MRRNPLTFDNHFDPEPTRRYPRSRVVASIVAPPRQRAQVERLAESPHTFRVIVVDTVAGLDFASLSQPGCITLPLPLAKAVENELLRAGTEKEHERFSLYSAFTLLHRVGDALDAVVFEAAMPPDLDYDYYSESYKPTAPKEASVRRYFDFLKTQFAQFSRGYLPVAGLSVTTMDLVKRMGAAMPVPVSSGATGRVLKHIVKNTNSDMSRRGGWLNSLDVDYSAGAYQCVADWVALSELPAARARPGRGEPWLLLPPKPGEHSSEMEQMLVQYTEVINTYFPAFVQSLLDDLDGAVIRV
jgi:hypothetical protein